MTNKYAGYPQPIPGGYRAMIRVCRDAKPNPIMEQGEKPKVLDTEGAAWREIALHLLAFMNGREIRGERFEGQSITDRADAMFNLSPSIKQRGQQRRIPVERRKERA